MPFNVDSPMDQTLSPTRYPQPNWLGDAEVRECWLPNEKPVGWLVIQDDTALSWLSAAGPDRPAAYAVKEIVQELIVDSIAQDMTPREAYNRCISVTMFRAPEILSLKAFGARLQEEWS